MRDLVAETRRDSPDKAMLDLLSIITLLLNDIDLMEHAMRLPHREHGQCAACDAQAEVLR